MIRVHKTSSVTASSRVVLGGVMGLTVGKRHGEIKVRVTLSRIAYHGVATPMSDRRRSLELYRRQAPGYGAHWTLRRLRREAVAALELQPGQVVLDVGCGIGLNFRLLQEGIGPQGQLIGVEQSPDMLARARSLVASEGWTNVTLLEAPAEEAVIPLQADAALLVLVHDVLQSDEALTNVLRSMRPGGRLVIAGRKWAPWFLWPVNVLNRRTHWRFQTTSEGMDRPWDKLERLAPGLTVRTLLPGNKFVAWGRLAQP